MPNESFESSGGVPGLPPGEIEVKIKVRDINSINKKILGVNAKLEKSRYLEENILYDFRSGNLFRKNQALRVRKINKKIYLTFKGPPQKSRKFKIREEYESEIKNGKQFLKILKSLGFIPVFSYKKFRTVYSLKYA